MMRRLLAALAAALIACSAIAQAPPFNQPPASGGGSVSGNISITGATITGGTATSDVQPLGITQTWNNAGVAFTAIRLNVTNTASATGSNFADFQIGGTSATSFGNPGTNSTLGTITYPQVKLVSGVDTLTLSSDNNYTSTMGAANGLILSYGTGNMVGIVSPGSIASVPVDQSPNGISLWRRGILFGRHAGQIATGPTVMGPIGLAVQVQAVDEAASELQFLGQSAYSQATTNTAGGAVRIAGGIGRRYVTIADYTTLGGKVVTVTVNGTTTTLTEGVNWTAATSNGATATSLGTALDAVAGVDVVVSSNVVYVVPTSSSAATGPVYSLSLTSNNAGAVVTAGVDGSVNIKGSSTNDSACTGCVGEVIESNILIGSRITLTGLSGTPTNITSISLTPGQWMVCGVGTMTGAAAVSLTYWGFGISTTSATNPLFDKRTQTAYAAGTTALTNGNLSAAVPCFSTQLASTTTHYLVVDTAFTASTPDVFGRITAIRMR